MRTQVSISRSLVFIFTITLLTLSVLRHLSYGDTAQIYWTDLETSKIQRANLDGSNIQDIIVEFLAIPLGVALDVDGGKMYWANWFFTGSIRRANLDGSNVQDIVTEELENPWNIALDIDGEKIYWADIVTGKVQRANLDGSNVQDIVTGLDKPWDIALDVAGEKIYWTDRNANKIQRSNLDGTNLEDIITEGLENPSWITLDVAGEKIYWTDSGKVQRANLDGSNVEDIITEGLDDPRDIALDVAAGKMYWTHAEWSEALDAYTNGKVQRANLDGSNVQDIVTGLERPAGIALGFDIPYQSTPAVFESARPPGGELAPNGPITVTFSSNPGDVTSSAGTVTGFGKTRTITGPFTLGALSLTIAWTNGDGSLTLTYNIIAPDVTAPAVTGGTVKDGDKDVNPEKINSDGKIEITFSEDVSGNIALYTVGGADVGWIGYVLDTKGTLELVAGKDIGAETTYVIKGKVSDAAGNKTEVSITFTTKGAVAQEDVETTLDTNTGEQIHRLTGLIWVSSVAFSPDGNTIVIGNGSRVDLWDVTTGAFKATLGAHWSGVESVVFSPDGKTIASGGDDEAVRLWDVATGTETVLRAHEESVNSVAFSPDGSTLASGSGIPRTTISTADSKDNTVRLWDVATGTLKATLTGHTNTVNSVAFSPDGTYLVSGSSDNTMRLWVTARGTLLSTTILNGDVISVAFSPDGKTIASGSENGAVELWDINATTPLKNTLRGHQDDVSSVAFSPDGTTLASGSYVVFGRSWDRAVLLWDVATGTLKHELIGRTDDVRSVAFSPDGKTLASGSSDGTVLLWELAPSSPPPLPGDVNADGAVNIQDLVLVASRFGETGENAADVNGDGVVNIQDLVLVAGAFGDAAAAPTAHTLSLLTPETVQQWLTAAGQLRFTDTVSLRGIAVLEHLLATLIPKETALLANYPNPFNPETWIPYQLSKPADVTLTIYAVDGQVVRQLALGHQPAGIYQSRSRAAYWDGRNTLGESVASGVYFYTLSTESTRDSVTAGEFTATRKMLIRK